MSISFPSTYIKQPVVVPSNEYALKRAGDEDLSKTIMRRRWRYLGHALIMKEKIIPLVAWKWVPTGEK